MHAQSHIRYSHNKGTVGLQNFCKQRFVRLELPNGIKAKAEIACIIFHLLMSTHVNVLQRLKALGMEKMGRQFCIGPYGKVR